MYRIRPRSIETTIFGKMHPNARAESFPAIPCLFLSFIGEVYQNFWLENHGNEEPRVESLITGTELKDWLYPSIILACIRVRREDIDGLFSFSNEVFN